MQPTSETLNTKARLPKTGNGLNLFRLQIMIFVSYVDDARARLMGVQVVVSDDDGAGVTLVQLFE